MGETSTTARIKLVGDGSTKTGGTVPIFIAGRLTKSEDERTVSTNTYTNDEHLQVSDVIDSEIDSDEGSNCNMGYSFFCCGR